MRLSGRRGPRTPRSPSDLVVVSPVRSGCARHAGGTGDLLKMQTAAHCALTARTSAPSSSCSRAMLR